MSNDLDMLYQMVRELFEVVDDLTEWENQFINDLSEYEDDNRKFTDAQIGTLEDLHKKVFG